MTAWAKALGVDVKKLEPTKSDSPDVWSEEDHEEGASQTSEETLVMEQEQCPYCGCDGKQLVTIKVETPVAGCAVV